MTSRIFASSVLCLALLLGAGIRLLRAALPQDDDHRVVTLKRTPAGQNKPVRLVPVAPAAGTRSLFEEARNPPVERVIRRMSKYHERDAREWQGMPIDVTRMPYCESSAQCGLARACVDAKCGPCRSDADCAPGEACVLNHCVIARLVGCRRQSECGAKISCILTGYTTDPRGNGGLSAICLTPDRVPEQKPPDYPPSAYIPEPSRMTAFQEHLRSQPR